MKIFQNMTTEIESLIKTIVAVVSTFIGLLSYLRAQRQKQLITASLWSLFIKQQNNFSTSQTVLRLYKEKHSDNLDTEILIWASKTESFDQHIFEDIMNQIFVADNKLTLEKVERYFNEGKISEYDKKVFQMMINEPQSLTFIQRVYKSLGIPL